MDTYCLSCRPIEQFVLLLSEVSTDKPLFLGIKGCRGKYKAYILRQSSARYLQPNFPPWGAPYNGLYGGAPPERRTFFTLQVYETVGISRVEVYERVGKSVI